LNYPGAPRDVVFENSEAFFKRFPEPEPGYDGGESNLPELVKLDRENLVKLTQDDTELLSS